jgi:CRP-like cAMP-binding protein
VVGEISYLLDSPRSADLKAETDCVLKVVEDVDSFFSEDPGHGLEIARLLARRLHDMDEKFLEVRGLLKDAGGEVPGEAELPPELQPFRRYLKRLKV